MKIKLFLCLFLCTQWTYARVEVAFLKALKPDGTPVQLEPGSTYSHVAISYRNRWLQVHPYRGVELVDTNGLKEMGSLTTIIEIPDRDEPSPEFVQKVVGTPYDWTFSWDGPRYYCSKLVGKFLHLHPLPMNFNADIWPPRFHEYNGLPGISPQGVYTQLIELGYAPRCANALIN
jgi:hypothetical protein